MASAEERAKAASTSTSVLGAVKTQDFLIICLKKAKLDADLLQDIAEACEMNDLNALELGGGELTPEQAADKLFLMQDEARALLHICKQECLRAGVDYGDGSKYEPSEGQEDDVTAPASASAANAQHSSGSKDASAPSPAPPFNGRPDVAALNTPASQSQPQAHNLGSTTSQDQEHVPQPAANDDRAQPPAVHPNKQAKPSVTPSSTTFNTKHVALSPTAAGTVPKPSPPSAGPAKHVSSSINKTPSTSGANGDHAQHAVATPPQRQASKSAVPSASRPDRPDSRAASTTPSTSSGGADSRKAQASPFTPQPPAVASPAESGTVTPAMASKDVKRLVRPASAPAVSKAAAKRTATTTPSLAEEPVEAEVPVRATASASKAQKAPPRPQSATPKSEHLPSYARPTAAFKNAVAARQAGDDPLAGTPVFDPRASTASTDRSLRSSMAKKASPAPGTPISPTDSDAKQTRKGAAATAFENISSSLLKPTKAFLAWASGNSKEERLVRELGGSQALRTSQTLGDKKATDTRAGTRSMSAGGFASFQLSSDSRKPGPKLLTTDELQMLKAQEEIGGKFKARPVPKAVREGPTPLKKEPQLTTPEPFKLASMERHQKAQEEWTRKAEEQRLKEEAEFRTFRAIEVPRSVKGGRPSMDGYARYRTSDGMATPPYTRTSSSGTTPRNRNSSSGGVPVPIGPAANGEVVPANQPGDSSDAKGHSPSGDQTPDQYGATAAAAAAQDTASEVAALSLRSPPSTSKPTSAPQTTTGTAASSPSSSSAAAAGADSAGTLSPGIANAVSTFSASPGLSAPGAAVACSPTPLAAAVAAAIAEPATAM